MNDSRLGVEDARRVAEWVDSTAAVCMVLDANGQLRWANAAVTDVTGRDPAADETHATSFFAAEDHERVAATIATVVERGFARLTVGLRTAASDTLAYEFLGAHIEDGNILVVGWPAASGADTEARQAILDRMTDGFLALGRDREITYLNDRAFDLLTDIGDEGAPADDRDALYGRSLGDVLPTPVVDALHERCERAMANQEPAAFELHRPESDRFFEGDIYPSESGLSVYVREVTERRRAARERDRSERALRELYRVSADPDPDFDEKLEEVLEIGCERLGLPIAFLTRIEDGTMTVMASRGSHPELQKGDSCPLEETYCRRTLETAEPTVVTSAVGDSNVRDVAYERFELGAYVGVKVYVAGELYGTLCFAASNARPGGFGDEERNFIELLSQWVRYELEHQRDEAVLKRQNERLEEFASIVSHDLRNPLNVAQGNVELALETGETDRLASALDALDRAEELVSDVLALARQGRVVDSPEPVPLTTVANAAWSAVSPGESTMTVEENISVEADRERLRALFENLFRNSVEHGADGEPVHIEVGPLPGGFYVADDGKGIDPADAEQIFDHGFTTNEDGTGLGLSIVRTIAEAHGWEVELAGGEDGTRFEFRGVELV